MSKAGNRKRRFAIAQRLVLLGMGLNFSLMLAKLVVGARASSTALWADGLESGGDVFLALVLLWAVRLSRKPYDPCHPYGHGKIESMAALLIGVVIMATGVWVVVTAGLRLMQGTAPAVHWLATVIAALTVVSQGVAARYTGRRARMLGSPALFAIAQDQRKDAITSIATTLGVGAAACGLSYLDPAVALLTAAIILHAGYTTFKKAFDELVDAALPEAEIADIRADAVAVEGVEHVHEIRGRRSGQFLIIDLKLEMDPLLTVQRSHEIAERVKRRIFRRHPVVGDVMIHVNPHDDGAHTDLIRL